MESENKNQNQRDPQRTGDIIPSVMSPILGLSEMAVRSMVSRGADLELQDALSEHSAAYKSGSDAELTAANEALLQAARLSEQSDRLFLDSDSRP